MKDIKTPLHFFLTSGASNGKTFAEKAIYQALIRIYKSSIENDWDKPKVLIMAYIEKPAYNISRITLQSIFHIPLNKSKFLPLNSETLNTTSKHYDQFHVLLIDEISLVGLTFLHYNDKHLCDIKKTPIIYFKNVDKIFCGDLYQV